TGQVGSPERWHSVLIRDHDPDQRIVNMFGKLRSGIASAAQRAALAHPSVRIGRSSRHSSAAAAAASPARSRKNPAWLALLHNVPTMPASRLPLKMARNHDATVVAPSLGGASLANRPSP